MGIHVYQVYISIGCTIWVYMYIKCTYALAVPYGYKCISGVHMYWIYHMGVHVYLVNICIGYTIWVYMYIRCKYVLAIPYGYTCNY